MMAAFCSLLESEREKESPKIVEVDVRVSTPTEDVRNQLVRVSSRSEVITGRLLAESPNGPRCSDELGGCGALCPPRLVELSVNQRGCCGASSASCSDIGHSIFGL